MRDLLVTPRGRSEDKNVVLADLPGDKSISHRALLVAVLTPGTTILRRLNRALAVEELLEALQLLKCGIDDRGEAVIVSESRERIRESCARCPELHLGSSSTAARLLIGLLAGLSVDAIVTGDASLRARPMDWIVDPLRQLGAVIDYLDRPGRLPIRLRRSPLAGGAVTMRVTSAQASSAILMAAVAAGVPVRVARQRGSRDHTERMLRAMGVNIRETDDAVEIGDVNLIGMPEYEIPVDPSSAAYPVAAQVLLRHPSSLQIPDVALNPARRGVFDLLTRMGAAVDVAEASVVHGEPIGSITVTAGGGRLKGFDLAGRTAIHSMIDELPLAAGLAAYAAGRSSIQDAEELVFKETNRLTTTAALLGAFGVPATASDNGLIVDGSTPRRLGAVDSFGDHRIAMTAAVLAATVTGPVRITSGGCFQTSFPGFLEAMALVGCDMRLVDGVDES